MLKTQKKFLSRFHKLYDEFMKSHDGVFIISEKELMKFSLDKSIIAEDIFKNDEFMKLFEYVKNSNESNFILSPKDIADYLPVKSKIRRKLLKPYFDKPLYMSIVNENSINEISSAVEYWTNLNEENDAFRNFVTDVYNSFTTAAAMFYKADDGKGIIFLRKSKFTVDDFKHEFIHYYRWVLKDEADQEIDQDWLFEAHKSSLNKFMEMFNLDEDDIKYFSDFDEFETMLNDAISLLLKTKEKKYKEMKKNDFADLVFSTFFFSRKNMTTVQYLEKISSSEMINEIENSLPLQFIVFNVIVDYNVNKMKTHIFSMLTEKRRYLFK